MRKKVNPTPEVDTTIPVGVAGAPADVVGDSPNVQEIDDAQVAEGMATDGKDEAVVGDQGQESGADVVEPDEEPILGAVGMATPEPGPILGATPSNLTVEDGEALGEEEPESEPVPTYVDWTYVEANGHGVRFRWDEDEQTFMFEGVSYAGSHTHTDKDAGLAQVPQVSVRGRM